MKGSEMTELQRQALEHVASAHREGLTLCAYAKGHGISARQVYDATAQLRRRGLLPRPATLSKKFVAVKIAPAPPGGRSAVCRIVVPGALAIECAEWPPPSWLSAVMAERRDAAS